MIEPVRMGRYLETDAQGFIRPDVAHHLIGGAWKPLVDHVAAAFMDTGAVAAIYLRGSVPRGLAVDGVSDIDFVYLSDHDLTAAEQAIAARAQKEFPVARKVECLRIDADTLDRIIPPRQRPPVHMMLKTQGLFLAGADVTSRIAPFRPGLEMASHAFDIAGEFSILPRLLEKAGPGGNVTEIHQWISKRIVRAGFEVTMDRSPRFTRDLYLCFEQFAAFYPGHARQMRIVLGNCLDDGNDPAPYGELVALIRSESRRLLAGGR
jgi:hypothetical protein